MLGLLSEYYIGIGFSPPMIEAARRRFPDVDLRIGDVRGLSHLPRQDFGLAVFSFNGINTLGHLDRAIVLTQLHVAIRPGGLLVFCD